MSHTTPNVALFIDADNISAHFVHKIIGTLSTHGNIIVRRVYANWSKPLAGWQQAITENAMVAIQQFDHLSGKNSSDMGSAIKKAFGVGSHDLGYRTFADFFANFEEYELQKNQPHLAHSPTLIPKTKTGNCLPVFVFNY